MYSIGSNSAADSDDAQAADNASGVVDINIDEQQFSNNVGGAARVKDTQTADVVVAVVYGVQLVVDLVGLLRCCHCAALRLCHVVFSSSASSSPSSAETLAKRQRQVSRLSGLCRVKPTFCALD